MGSPILITSELQTVNRTGTLVKDVRMMESRRMTTTMTKMMLLTLLTNRIGTTEIEENAFRMVREKILRCTISDKKREFQVYPSLSKREKIDFLVKNREDKVNYLNVTVKLVVC